MMETVELDFPVKVIFHGSAARGRRRWLRQLIGRLGAVTPLQSLTIHFVNSQVVRAPTGIMGFGIFTFAKRWNGGEIWIATMPVPEVPTGEFWRRHLPHTLAHEIAHYEQYRDGRRVQERGVNVRARSLLKHARKHSAA